MRSAFWFVTALAIFAGTMRTTATAETRAEKPPQFETDVLPILKAKCFDCHSSTADELQGGLKLDNLELILQGGTSGAAIVEGDVENSLLLKAIRYEVEDMQMPPSGKLDDEKISLLEAWVKSLKSDE